MQLETVGLDMLNMDGTLVKDNQGNSIPTYDTMDTLTMARVWTGFEFAARRANYEDWSENSVSWNDPMLLKDVNRHGKAAYQLLKTCLQPCDTYNMLFLFVCVPRLVPQERFGR